MKNTGLIIGALLLVFCAFPAWAQEIPDNKDTAAAADTMGNGAQDNQEAINDEGYGANDAEYYGAEVNSLDNAEEDVNDQEEALNDLEDNALDNEAMNTDLEENDAMPADEEAGNEAVPADENAAPGEEIGNMENTVPADNGAS